MLWPTGDRDRQATDGRRTDGTGASPSADTHWRVERRALADVPLWWDAGTLADLAAWKSERLGQGAATNDPFVAAKGRGCEQVFSRHTLRKRFRTACKVLGPARLESLTIHHGRHTFISHALAGGRTLAEVRDAVGHSNVSITSAYLHVAVEDEQSLGSLFAFRR